MRELEEIKEEIKAGFEERLRYVGDISTVSTSTFTAFMAYEFETHLHNLEVNNNIIREVIDELRTEGKWPAHLQFVTAFANPESGANGVAIRDTRTNEITIGFAGTNFDTGNAMNTDIVRNREIAYGGFNPNSPHVLQAVEFVERINRENPLTPVTNVTGHSLGGKWSQIVGLSANVPHLNIHTYNSAPLQPRPWLSSVIAGILPTNSLHMRIPARMLGMSNALPPLGTNHANTLARARDNQRTFSRLLANHNGQIIHFHTTHDVLTNLAKFGRSTFAGHHVLIDNGAGHEMSSFLTNEAQAIIRDRTLFFSKQSEVLVNLRHGDIEFPEGIRVPTNLLGGSGRGQIIFRPEMLHTVASNLQNTMGSRFELMHEAISLAKRQNDEVKEQQFPRIRKLADDLFDELLNIGLDDLLRHADMSYGNIDQMELNLLNRVRQGQLPWSFRETFNNRHNRAPHVGRIWLLDGDEWRRSQVTTPFNTIVQGVTDLQLLLTQGALHDLAYPSHLSPAEVSVKSIVSSAYTHRFHDTISVMLRSIRGRGQGNVALDDSIAMKVDDLFNALGENVTTAGAMNNRLEEGSRFIANSAVRNDQLAALRFRAGSGHEALDLDTRLQEVELKLISPQYLRADENIKDALRSQRRLGGDEVHEAIVRNVGNVNVALQDNVNLIISICETIQGGIEQWERVMSLTVSEILLGNLAFEEGLSPGERIHHYQLSDYVDFDLINDIRRLSSLVEDWLSQFTKVKTSLESFQSQFLTIRDTVHSHVGEAVYQDEEMATKHHIVNGIGLMLGANASELEQLAHDIDSSMAGRAISGYTKEILLAANFFRLIEDSIRSGFKVFW